MNVTLDQAIEMHARMMRNRWKDDASARALGIAHQLRQTGDEEGAVIYEEVAQLATAVRSLTEQTALQQGWPSAGAAPPGA